MTVVGHRRKIPAPGFDFGFHGAERTAARATPGSHPNFRSAIGTNVSVVAGKRFHEEKHSTAFRGSQMKSLAGAKKKLDLQPCPHFPKSNVALPRPPRGRFMPGWLALPSNAIASGGRNAASFVSQGKRRILPAVKLLPRGRRSRRADAKRCRLPSLEPALYCIPRRNVVWFTKVGLLVVAPTFVLPPVALIPGKKWSI